MPEAGADDVLRQLVQEVRQLQRRVADLEVRPRRRLAGQDHEAATVLLPVIAAAIGAQSFVVAELLALAATAAPGADALRLAIAGAAGPLDAGTGRRLGKLLRRLDGADVGGLTVARIGRESAGAIWCVRVSVAAKPIPAIATRARAA